MRTQNDRNDRNVSVCINTSTLCSLRYTPIFLLIPLIQFLQLTSINLRLEYISFSVQHIRQKQESNFPCFELDIEIMELRDYVIAKARRHLLIVL